MTVEQILGHLIEQHTENPDGNEESMCRLLHKELTIRHADKVETTLVPRPKTKCSNAHRCFCPCCIDVCICNIWKT